MTIRDSRKFWREAFTGMAQSPHGDAECLLFGLFATLVCLLAWLEERYYQVEVGLEIAPLKLRGRHWACC